MQYKIRIKRYLNWFSVINLLLAGTTTPRATANYNNNNNCYLMHGIIMLLIAFT